MNKPSVLVGAIGRVSPFGIGDSLVRLHALGCFSSVQLVGLSLLSLLLAVTETFSVALMMPLLIFIERNRDIEALAAGSRLWAGVRDVFGAVGVPVSLITLALCVLVMIFLRQAVFFAESVHTMHLKHHAATVLARQMFQSIFRSNATHIQGLGTGRFQQLLDDLPGEAATIIRFYGLLLASIASIAAYSSVILVASPLAAICSFVVVIAVLGLLRGFVKRSRAVSESFVSGRALFRSYLAERYAAWRLIKLSTAGAAEQERFENHFEAMTAIKSEKFRISVAMESAIVPTLSVVALSGMVLAVEYSSLALSTVTTFMLVLIRMIPITRTLSSQRQRISTFCVMLDRFMGQLAETDGEAEADVGTMKFAAVREAISFENVSVVYPGKDTPALDGVTVTIPARSICAVVGPSGAGKSTFVDLLPRLLRPNQGVVRYDGRPIDEFSLSSLRASIAYVAQKPLLLTGTLRDNIVYGSAAASDDDVIEAIRLADFEDCVAALPHGLDTLVGEGGVGLSGGQQQRLALARAFLQRADLLILDEPTSAQDYLTEHKLAVSLVAYQERTGSTIIVIAHRLNTVRTASHVVVLNGGRMVEAGPVASLALSDGWFSGMVESHGGFDNREAEQGVG